ncbi:hypothetical protein CR513_07164, partial [Mucuna pruriens]
MKGGVELGRIVSALTRNDDLIVGTRRALPKKCRKPRIVLVPCTIGNCTFADAMLDLGASINVMSTSIYKSLNCRDLEPTRMTIQLANRSVGQPLGVLVDVLVQVYELIFPTDFYVLNMEDETPGKGSTLILGRPFLMITKTKVDVHAETLLMEFGDTLMQFKIFEAIKHPMKDTLLFSIDLINELVKEHMQADIGSTEFFQVARNTNILDCLGSVFEEPDYDEPSEVHDAKVTTALAHLDHDSKTIRSWDHVGNPSTRLQTVSTPIGDVSPPKPPIELKPLPDHLKYAYLGNKQKFPIIIASNLHREQEEKLLQVVKQHKKAIR